MIYGIVRTLCNPINSSFNCNHFSIRPVKEVEGSLVVPLVSSSTGVRKWRYGRKPDELEEDNEGAGDSQQSFVKQEIVVTGDADTDQAVNELLQGVYSD